MVGLCFRLVQTKWLFWGLFVDVHHHRDRSTRRTMFELFPGPMKNRYLGRVLVRLTPFDTRRLSKNAKYTRNLSCTNSLEDTQSSP